MRHDDDNYNDGDDYDNGSDRERFERDKDGKE
jgi:hypothetical protein